MKAVNVSIKILDREDRFKDVQIFVNGNLVTCLVMTEKELEKYGICGETEFATDAEVQKTAG